MQKRENIKPIWELFFFFEGLKRTLRLTTDTLRNNSWQKEKNVLSNFDGGKTQFLLTCYNH